MCDLRASTAGKPIFTWTSSLWKNPLATLSNVVTTAFHETFEGVMGLPTGEAKTACFSFGYRINSIAPYTAVLPGGMFGSIMKSFVRAFMLVSFPVYASFRGIFALMIGVICKSGVLQAVKKLINHLVNITRLGLRGMRILFRRFGKLRESTSRVIRASKWNSNIDSLTSSISLRCSLRILYESTFNSQMDCL